MEFNEVINKRQSCRSYSNEEVSEKDLDEILLSGMKAPIAKGKYADYKLVVYSGSKMKELQKITFNHMNNDYTYGAPLMIVVAYKGIENEPMEQSVGAIMENMELCASNLNLDSVFLYTIKRVYEADEEYKKALNLGDYVAEACLAVGKGKDFKFVNKNHLLVVEKYTK